MRCRTSLNANQARRQRSKEPQYVGSPYPLANDNRALVVDTVNLKDILCDIEADPDRGHGDLSFEQQCCPADPIRTRLGSSGGRPPHLDSNHQYLEDKRRFVQRLRLCRVFDESLATATFFTPLGIIARNLSGR